MNVALDLFESKVSQETALSMPEAVLIQLHEHLLNEVLASFDSRRLLGEQNAIDNKKEELRTVSECINRKAKCIRRQFTRAHPLGKKKICASWPIKVFMNVITPHIIFRNYSTGWRT